MRTRNTFAAIVAVIFAVLLTIPFEAAAQQRNRRRRAKQTGIFPNPKTRNRRQTARARTRPKPRAANPAIAAAPIAPAANNATQPPNVAEPTNDRAPASQTNKNFNAAAPVNSDNVKTGARPTVAAAAANNKPNSRAASSEPLFRQVNDLIADLEKDGYRKKSDFVAEKMKDNGSWINAFEVQQAKRYVLLALCDENCPAMKLNVYDERGKLILTHKEKQLSRPTIYFTPRRTGIYRFKTIVASCDKEPCRAALSVYER